MTDSRSRDRGNEGMIVSGGSVTAQQMAVGRNASIELVHASQALDARGLDEVKQKLDALLAAVKEYSGPPQAREQLIQSATAVAGELAKDKPNTLTVASVLDGIARSVGTVTGIVKAAEALKAAVTAFF